VNVVIVYAVDQVLPPKRLFDAMMLLLLLLLLLMMLLLMVLLVEVQRLCVERERGKSGGDRCVLQMSKIGNRKMLSHAIIKIEEK
jgi:hypothetical protein